MRIISKNINILNNNLKEKFIKWPSDSSFTDLLERYDSFTYGPFKNHICVVDGTEIQIRRSIDYDLQKESFSMKKHQHSLNFMLITLIDGRIIYCSKGYMILQDQDLWNELNLRKLFIEKEFGIIGDDGFFFNPKKTRNLPKIKGLFFLFFLRILFWDFSL